MRNHASYAKRGYSEVGLFVYRGTTPLKKGRGMCYDLDYLTTETGETANDAFGARGLVEIQQPSNANNMAFAGVLTQDYPATPSGKIQLVELYLPGSTCLIDSLAAMTINSTVVTAIADAEGGIAGRFGPAGFMGRGSALALQTRAVADKGDLAEVALAGTATAVYSSSTGLTTITLTGIGTACGNGDATVDPADYECIVLGGADDATGGDAATGELAAKGVYNVSTAPTANTITVVGDTGDCDLTLVVKKKNALVMAYLFDGEESGLIEYLTPQDGVAVQSMVGGVSMICGGYTMAADSTATLADGTRENLMKGIFGLGTLTTKDWIITVTSGMKADMTALASLAFDAAAEVAVLKWNGSIGGGGAGLWVEQMSAGATKA